MASTLITTNVISDDAVTAAKLASSAVVTASIVDDAVTAAKIADNSIDIARLNVSDGSNGQALTTNGSGTLSFASVGAADGSITTAKLADDAVTAAKIADSVSLGAYNDWAIKTTTYTAANKDQLIANHASTAFTITLPASPSAGNTVIIKNVGNALVTVGRNSSNIDSVAADGSLPKGNAVQLVYVDSTIGWVSL